MDGRQRASWRYRLEKIADFLDFLLSPGSFESGLFVLSGIFVYQIVIFCLKF